MASSFPDRQAVVVAAIAVVILGDDVIKYGIFGGEAKDERNIDIG
jgi:hypothetical protein